MQINANKKYCKEAIIEVKDISKYYTCEYEEGKIVNFLKFMKKKEPGLKNISFEIFPNQVLGIVGGEKCGKSTLLKLLSGIIKPSSGAILYKGAKVTDSELRELVCYSSKERTCCQDLSSTVLENIIQSNCGCDSDRCQAVDMALKLIEDFGLDDHAYKETSKLPSSVRKKVFIIRGLLSNKPVLCFDQPFDYIEDEYKDKFKSYIAKLVEAGKSIVITSTSTSEIENFCNKIINI